MIDKDFNDFIDSQRQVDDLLKDGIPTRQISEENSLFGQIKQLEKERVNEFRNYVASQQAENDRKERQAVIDRRQQRKHDFIVAGFSSVTSVFLTLFVEHFHKILSFVLKIFS